MVALETQLEPLPLLQALLAIERELGRDRSRGALKGPRTLDLDLLVMGDCIVAGEELSLPHPALAQRRFVLAPLAEIAPAAPAPGELTERWQSCWPCCPMRARTASPPYAGCPLTR